MVNASSWTCVAPGFGVRRAPAPSREAKAHDAVERAIAPAHQVPGALALAEAAAPCDLGEFQAREAGDTARVEAFLVAALQPPIEPRHRRREAIREAVATIVAARHETPQQACGIEGGGGAIGVLLAGVAEDHAFGGHVAPSRSSSKWRLF